MYNVISECFTNSSKKREHLKKTNVGA